MFTNNQRCLKNTRTNSIMGIFYINIIKIRHIPTVIVQGRYDVVCPMVSAWELSRALPEADFEVIQDAGHSMTEEGIATKLVEYTDRFSVF